MKETIKSMQAIAEPFLAFLRWEASSGVILLACAILALIVANSPLAESYEHLLHYPIAIGAGEYVLEMGLLHWINDGLMAVFFFVIGLEIKREFLYGELRTYSAMLLPVGAALGVRCGSVFHVVWNQERANLGLDTDAAESHDTDKAIRVAVGAISDMIANK